jgi:ribosome modulation factor
MIDAGTPPFPPDPISEGAHARGLGRPKDACPYPAGSAERKAWLEGYDGTPSDDGPDLPLGNG